MGILVPVYTVLCKLFFSINNYFAILNKIKSLPNRERLNYFNMSLTVYFYNYERCGQLVERIEACLFSERGYNGRLSSRGAEAAAWSPPLLPVVLCSARQGDHWGG